MDKHVVISQFLFDEAMRCTKEGIYTHVLIIVYLIPLMVLYANPHYLALHSERLVRVIINDSQN